MNILINNFFKKTKIRINDFCFLFFLFLLLILLLYLKLSIFELLSLSFVTIITLYFSKKYKSLATILYVALCVRLTVILLGNYFITLPDSTGDAAAFELKAIEWSERNFIDLIKNTPRDENSYYISWVLAFVYKFLDKSLIIGQSVSLLLAIGSILLGIQIANKIWNETISIKFGWILALYPTLILYSGLILREAYVWFFLSMAIYGFVCWFKDRRLKLLIISFSGFLLATFFHGGMIIGGIILLIIIGLINLQELLKKIRYLKISIKHLFTFILSIFIIYYVLVIANNIPKLDSMKNLLDLNNLLINIDKKNINNAAFPEWTIPRTTLELIYKSPIRIIYFLFSPFPWDMNKISHVFGSVDGIFHIILFALLIKNFKSIWNNKLLRIVLIIFISYLIIYGLSTGNFGTGVRHRTKIISLFILLVLPWIPNITLNKKKL